MYGQHIAYYNLVFVHVGHMFFAETNCYMPKVPITIYRALSVQCDFIKHRFANNKLTVASVIWCVVNNTVRPVDE